MFTEFPVGSEYLQSCLLSVQKYGQLMSPIGRVRHLWRVFTGRRGVIAAAGRRAQNSPIQGFASEIGASAAFRSMREAYLWLLDHQDWNERFQVTHVMVLMPRYCRAVHDCNVFLVPYAFVLVHLHIYCFTATTGISNWYRDVFDVEFSVIPEIEAEIFADEADSKKWDWQIPNLLSIIWGRLKAQVQLGFLPPEELDRTWDTVMYPWRSKTLRRELCTKYPLLDVDVEDVIVKSLKEFVRE